MGDCPNLQARGALPQGSVEFIFESDECCSCDSCNRSLDKKGQELIKPNFVTMSDSEWELFKDQARAKVKAYMNNGRFVLVMMSSLFIAMFLFHPALNVLGVRRRRLSDFSEGCCLTTQSLVKNDYGCHADSMECKSWADEECVCLTGGMCTTDEGERPCVDPTSSEESCPEEVLATCSESNDSDFCPYYEDTKHYWMMHWSDNRMGECENYVEHEPHDEDAGRSIAGAIGLMMFSMIVIIPVMISGNCHMTKKNQQVDAELEALLAHWTAQNHGATFWLCKQWTEVCKPKGARPYRAIIITPTASAHLVPANGSPAGVMMAAPPPPNSTTLAIVVPPDTAPGAVLKVQNPNTKEFMDVAVPAGTAPGSTIHVSVPAAQPAISVQATIVS